MFIVDSTLSTKFLLFETSKFLFVKVLYLFLLTLTMYLYNYCEGKVSSIVALAFPGLASVNS